jgi:LytS/YehU family sensor histidine kinase
MSDRPWARWALGFALFTLAGVLFGTQFYVSNSQLGGTSPASAFIIDQVLYWYVWGILFPGMLWLFRRFPVDQPPRGRALAVHALGGLAAGYVHASVYLALSRLLDPLLHEPSASEPWSQVFARLNMPMRVVNYYLFVAGMAAVTSSRKYVERTVAASRLETELALAKVQMLRAQMQPHFLFNALNAVSGLVRSGEPSRAVTMIAGLSELLRSALDAGDAQVVTLDREIAFVRRYLEIEEVRFSDRLRVTIDVPPGLASTKVPSFLLQPLVENAILHGIARRPSSGRIAIAAAADGRTLRLSVSDDGAGLDAGWSMERDAGIGLRNTAERLRHLYGKSAGLVLAASPGGGATAEVTIPLDARGEGASA